MNKNILMGVIAALSIASASAETIYISGSTAFRSAANSALYSLFGDKLAATDKGTTNDAGAGALLFTNCTANGSTFDIAVAWGGSEQGIQSAASGAANKTLPFFDKTKITSGAVTSRAAGNMSTLATTADTSLQKTTICFSDTFQGASIFNSTASDGVTYNSLKDIKVGVVPFSFVANKTCPYTDITTSTYNGLQKNGYCTGSLFSGDATETNTKVWIIGRNGDSGTRVTALAVGKYGVTVPVVQCKVAASAGVITGLSKSPAGTINGITFSTGNNGESSGGTLCNYMTNAISSTVNVTNSSVTAEKFTGVSRGSVTNYLVGYAGVSDAAGVYSSGLKYLTYNGVKPRCYGTATKTVLDEGYTNIISGKYPFWGYEHVMYDEAYGTAAVTNFVTSLTNYISGLSSTSSILAPNIALGDMKVSRTADAGVVAPQ